ncbi:archaemetzincin family Zn-dependent metalloprotease [candidate division KSB1 bacterium]|nr:archaemetzincin family Zn-dependent metalloprotease [candidate division KSB1 bacterium]
MSKNICIVPVELNDYSLIENLVLYLNQTFEFPVHVKTANIKPHLAYDQRRLQYSSSILLKQLIDNSPEPLNQSKFLALCEFDLFIPIFTYVFGEAQLNGPAAIVSVHRLQNEFYGGSSDREVLRERLIKEATHELGHTFGLYHCLHPKCVMNFSTYVEDIDDKSPLFCDQCKAEVIAGGE